jgi:FkbM family methyltransferase
MRPGFTLQVQADPVYRAIWLFGEFDPVETAFYARLLRPGDTAIDVGANFGWHTLGFAAAVGPTGRVHAFEPIPSSRSHLLANLALNQVADRVTVHPEALGAAPGQTTLYTFADASLAEASGSAQGRRDASPHVTAIETLDRALAGVAAPALIKIDTEGFELDVFRGATATLAPPQAPVLAFEINRTCLSHVAVAPAAIHAHLQAAGYDAFWRMDPGRGFVAATDFGWTGRPDHRNFIATKPHGVARVRAALGA